MTTAKKYLLEKGLTKVEVARVFELRRQDIKSYHNKKKKTINKKGVGKVKKSVSDYAGIDENMLNLKSRTGKGFHKCSRSLSNWSCESFEQINYCFWLLMNVYFFVF